eukprot:1585254-Amphidinium_carterae.2
MELGGAGENRSWLARYAICLNGVNVFKLKETLPGGVTSPKVIVIHGSASGVMLKAYGVPANPARGLHQAIALGCVMVDYPESITVMVDSCITVDQNTSLPVLDGLDWSGTMPQGPGVPGRTRSSPLCSVVNLHKTPPECRPIAGFLLQPLLLWASRTEPGGWSHDLIQVAAHRFDMGFDGHRPKELMATPH